MKLLRYGPAGQEKPGILDAAGAVTLPLNSIQALAFGGIGLALFGHVRARRSN